VTSRIVLVVIWSGAATSGATAIDNLRLTSGAPPPEIDMENAAPYVTAVGTPLMTPPDERLSPVGRPLLEYVQGLQPVAARA
jgi:hypothetical protein